MTLAHIAWRNVLRDKVRLVLTLLAIVVAVVAFVTLRTTLRSWDEAESVARRDRVVTRHKVTFVMPLPHRYVDEIRAAHRPDGTPLVAAATFASWFGGRDPRHDREFFATYAVDAATYFQVYDEIEVPPDQMTAFQRDRDAAIVGELLAQKLGWNVGDRVTLNSDIYPAPDDRPWTFTIAGIYRARAKSVDRQTFVFHWARLDDALPPDLRGHVGLVTSRVAPGVSAADAGRAIDAMFEDRDTQTLSQDERAFVAGFFGMASAVLDVVGVLSIVIFVILGLILANGIAMGVRERTKEYAALLAIGFRPAHVAALVAGEAAFVALLGGALGSAAARVLVGGGIARFFEENLASFTPVFRVTPATLGLSFAAVVALGVLAAAVPAMTASRLHVSSALRRVA